MLDEERPNTELGADPLLGARARFSGPPERRTLLRFDPAHIRDVVAGRTIAHAEIRLWSDSLAGTFAMHRVPDAHAGWEELTATWSCDKDEIPGNGLEDCASSWQDTVGTGPFLSSFKLFTGEPGWAKWRVTTDVMRMAAGEAHPGFVVLGDELNPGSEFVSREGAGVAHHPVLILSLVDPTFAPIEPEPTPIDRSSVTNTYDAMRFLLDPDRGLQFGYDPAALDPSAAGVPGGTVYDRDTGEPIPGVRITVLGHPELGEARSRTPTGYYEMLVNGGDTVTLRFEHSAYFTVDRTVEVPWNSWVPVPDIRMTPLTELECTPTIDGATGGLFEGPTRVDNRGSRSMALYVPPGTTASHEGGSLASFEICVGEYTIERRPTGGPNPIDPAEAMPVELPRATSYTHAAALELIAPGANPLVAENHLASPRFLNTEGGLYFYLRVDEFFDPPTTGGVAFPPGTAVPNGLYERSNATWSPDRDGIVVAVSDAPSGCVSTGTVTSPVPPAEVAAICASSAMPAGRYFRVPVDRFSLRDHNFWGGPLDSPMADPDVRGGDDDVGCSSAAGGSIIHCEAQALGESLPIAGTGLSLTYLSDRQRGRRERYRAVVTPLPTLPAADRRPLSVVVQLIVAGRVISARDHAFTAEEATRPITIDWDGRDRYGRELIGPQRGIVRIGYEHQIRYRGARASSGGGGGAGGAVASAIFGTVATGRPLVATGRGSFIDFHQRRIELGTVDDRWMGLGGWGIDARHHYDANGRRVHLGAGPRLDGTIRPDILTPSVRMRRESLTANFDRAMATDRAGTVYVWDAMSRRIRRLRRGESEAEDVFEHTYDFVAGLAVDETRFGPMLLVAEAGLVAAGSRLYRLDLTTGERSTLIEGGRAGCTSLAGSGEGPGTAVAASHFCYPSPWRLIGQDDGSILLFASNFLYRYADRGGAPIVQRLDWPSTGVIDDIARGPDGSLYVVMSGRVFVRSPEGLVAPFLEPNLDGDSGDGVPIVGAGIGAIISVAVDPGGNVCYLETLGGGGNRARCIYDGVVQTVAGGAAESSDAPSDADIAATRIRLTAVHAIDYLPDGSLALLIRSSVSSVVRVVRPNLPGELDRAHLVPSPDGSVLYDFDPAGAHVLTRDAITGAPYAQFFYDPLGRLSRIGDVESAATDVVWDDAAGEIRLVAPGGVTTTLRLNAAGYVSEVEDPAGSTVTLEYHDRFAGLLTRMVDARGAEHRYTYDDAEPSDTSPGGTGRLLTDRAPLDAPSSVVPLQTLTNRRFYVEPDDRVWSTSSLVGPADRASEGGPALTMAARSTDYRVLVSERRRLVREVEHAGAVTRTDTASDGSEMVSDSWDGTHTTATTRPDPRPSLGWGAPFPATSTVERPSATGTVSSTITRTRAWDGSVLTDTVTVPSATGTSTFSSSTEPRTPLGTGFVSTSSAASGDATRTSRTFTDGVGRVVRIESPGMYPTCIEYSGATSFRPSLIRTAPGCVSSAPTSQRRETRMAYEAGGELRWLTSTSSGLSASGRLTTSIVPDLRGWSDTITLPGRSDVVDLEYDAHGNITSFTPPGREAHVFTYTAREALEITTPPATSDWSGDEVEASVYRGNGPLESQTYRNGATLRTELDPATGYLARLFVESDAFANDLMFENDIGGRPIAIATTMGDLTLTYGGPVLESETYTLVGGRGVAGSISRTIGSAMLLDSERPSMCVGASCRARDFDYRYDADRLLVSARDRDTTLRGMFLGRTFVDGVTLTARSGLSASAASTDITTTLDTDGLGELAYTETMRGGTRLFEERICARDEHGRVTRRAERYRTSSGRTTVRVYRYEYDARGFLSRSIENVPASGSNGNGNGLLCGSGGTNSRTLLSDTSFGYDDAGNRMDLAFNDDARVTGGERGRLAVRRGRPSHLAVQLFACAWVLDLAGCPQASVRDAGDEPLADARTADPGSDASRDVAPDAPRDVPPEMSLDTPPVFVCRTDRECERLPFCDDRVFCVPGHARADEQGCVHNGPHVCEPGYACDSMVRGCRCIEVDVDTDGYLGSVCGGRDCDDHDPSVHPGASNGCDGRDSDCDGRVDELPDRVLTEDGDGDGFGRAGGRTMRACAAAGYGVEGDCSDTNASIHPGAPELCDGSDNDCNDLLDGPLEDEDRDGDPARACVPWGGDCDDHDPTVNYYAIDTICDGVDENCDGDPYDFPDFDGDGVRGGACGPDCNDEDPTIGAGPDADGDGWTVRCTQLGDCDDTNPDVHPGAIEICNDRDDACDIHGGAPEDRDGDGFARVGAACRDDLPGALPRTDCNDRLSTIRPGAPELCNGTDDDCDPATLDGSAEGACPSGTACVGAACR